MKLNENQDQNIPGSDIYLYIMYLTQIYKHRLQSYLEHEILSSLFGEKKKQQKPHSNVLMVQVFCNLNSCNYSTIAHGKNHFGKNLARFLQAQLLRKMHFYQIVGLNSIFWEILKIILQSSLTSWVLARNLQELLFGQNKDT